MAILRAYALPHPPLAVPGVGKGEEQKISKTLSAFDEIAKEIAALAPDTIIFVTPHNVIYTDYFHISPNNAAKGSFGRFGASDVRLEADYDMELAGEIARLAEERGIPAGTLGEKDSALDHGVMVPMWFINHQYRNYKALRVSLSGMENAEHYRMGQVIKKAAENTGVRAVLIASGDLSHKLTHDGPYGFAAEGAEFDELVVRALSDGDFLSLLKIPGNLRERASECGYGSLIILAGCFDRCTVDARLLSYEGPFGVGYAIAAFSPGEYDENRNILDKLAEDILIEAHKHQGCEDVYQALARMSLEYSVKYGKVMPFPDDLPDELISSRAGVFVSLHKNGRLRGCIGTISPSTDNIALEIIRNAVSAGLYDNRFDPVSISELPLLTYKVDVLSAPEDISEIEELDVKRYGVIVSSGGKRGLLLPNLEGIDTVDEQVAIARQKGGIAANASVKLERFEVIRHE